jgi:hypothetical protein
MNKVAILQGVFQNVKYFDIGPIPPGQPDYSQSYPQIYFDGNKSFRNS